MSIYNDREDLLNMITENYDFLVVLIDKVKKLKVTGRKLYDKLLNQKTLYQIALFVFSRFSDPLTLEHALAIARNSRGGFLHLLSEIDSKILGYDKNIDSLEEHFFDSFLLDPSKELKKVEFHILNRYGLEYITCKVDELISKYCCNNCVNCKCLG